MNFDIQNFLREVSVWAAPILLAVTLHEAAHGWVASKRGDNTAKDMGRVTFNPLKHIDLFGTILLPAMLLFASGGKYMFGFAKPVPVNFHNLKRPRIDMILVAGAGPAINFLIAIVAALSLHIAHFVPQPYLSFAVMNLTNAMWVNIVFGVFNMIPLPPLDGGRIAVAILPRPLSSWLASLERGGFLIIIAALFLLPWIGEKMGMQINVLGWLVGVPAKFVLDLVVVLTGLK